ncbi:endonuclease/exonuclease/phosphatase family protein [Nannocystis sp. SCPEA4]|uniref:endonuclease/exonuclease/phosphatase family protein n=1 Tax=Nannocystis sp. SCPEA4 TaxID=2996787 RepID=UPI00226F868F|nr:endonuclease/exonuclease/phosphatase family protein [Nannocystis sp. SCPEA4]MCY1062863.1 endonuclease/exonuclease/phosphatase family protein [Nannocystis sp. SCPEA4]
MPLARLRLSVLALAATSLACNALVPDDTSTGTGDDTSTSSPASPDLPPPGPEDIVVATFNVHLFFDMVCDSGQCGGGAFEEAYSMAEFNYRADQIAAAIDGLQADVVLLQEVESQDCLDALVERLPQFTTAYLGETGFTASIDTALLSRLPLIEIRSHGEAPIPLPDGGSTHFARDYLEAHLDAGGHRLIAFAAHFKSKNDDDPERRLAEAQAARDLIDLAVDNYPDALVVMGGDLNDVPESPPLQAIEADGGTSRVAAELGDDDWTYVYDGETRALDHLYLSTRSGGGSFVDGTARVLRTPGQDGWGGSDHAAVRGTFRVGG